MEKFSEDDRLGDQVKKVIERVIPRRYIPKNCGCGGRQQRLNKVPGFHPFKRKK